MELSTSELVLLRESQEESDFSFKTTSDELSDWLTIQRKSSSCLCSARQQERRGLFSPKEQLVSPFGGTDKSAKSYNRRFSAASSWNRTGARPLEFKFEHFLCSSKFIEQYRNIKRRRLEDSISKLIELRERHMNSSQGGRLGRKTFGKEDSYGSRSNATSDTIHSELGQQQRHGQEFAAMARPSLPQTGYFTGRKLVYPKDVGLSSEHSRSKRNGSQFHVKKPGVQVFNVRNAAVQGTGKPASPNKTWMVPRVRTACKSAPASRTAHKKVTPSPPSVPNKTANVADFNSAVEGHRFAKLLPKPCNPLEHLKDSDKTARHSEWTRKQQGLDYKNVFKDVFDFYEQHGGRSPVYVETYT